ncbi:MAG: alpha amylase C-terminal domain-containing protein, partial [Actinomycetota bacterium]
DYKASIISFLRKDNSGNNFLVVVLNFTPMVKEDYRIGVPKSGYWKEALNTDSTHYGGSGIGNMGGKNAENVPFHGKPYSLNITLPPLSAVIFNWDNGKS